MEEIFAKIKAHMLEGMVFHDEMARYYDFLGLDAHRDNHRKHYEEETKGYQKLCGYYMHHHNKLLPNYPMNRPDVIPESWFMYKRQDVDINTKKNALRSGIKKWVDWETETKDFYEEMCGELLNEGEIASAHFIMKYVKDVDCELAEATAMSLESL